MRVAVLSDIHSNLPALEAVLAALRPFDAVWQLGDIVGYGPEPNEVVTALQAIGAGGVRGNHDSAALGLIDADAFNDDARDAVEWTSASITESTRTWLSGLPELATQEDFTLVHGSPRDPTWEYIYSVPVARANFGAFTTTHCLVGHTHVPLVFRFDDGRIETLQPSHGSHLALDERRMIINPGSVGQPRDGDPRACGMLLDTETNVLEWHRVAYPVATTQQRMREAGLPPRLVERLSHGL
jgi:diadenosine tetraphosphatase ApaH/serine/threonine PP2A family protein phosphatase